MPAYWIYVIGLRKWWNFYDTLMWPLMGNYAKCVNIAFASTQHVTITSKRRNLTMWPFALHLLMFWGLRQKFLAEWSKASRYPQWCWIRYFWSPAMLYQRCWCKCSVAVVYRAGQPSRIVLPDSSLWIVLLHSIVVDFLINCYSQCFALSLTGCLFTFPP